MDEFQQRLNDDWIFDGTVKDIETLWLDGVEVVSRNVCRARWQG